MRFSTASPQLRRCELGAAFAGGADEHDGEALVERHRDERGLAVARDAFDADLLGVDGLVGLEIVEAARGAPGPGAQRAPVVGLARLAFVDEADDALGEAGAVVGLDAGGVDGDETPAGGDELLGGGRIGGDWGSGTRSSGGASGLGAGGSRGSAAAGRAAAAEGGEDGSGSETGESAAAEHHHDGDGPLGVGGRDEGHLDIDGDVGIRGIIDVADELFAENGVAGDGGLHRFGDGPGDFRNVRGDAAQDFALEILNDFGPALVPPLSGVVTFLPFFSVRTSGRLGKGFAVRFVVVGVVGHPRHCRSGRGGGP